MAKSTAVLKEELIKSPIGSSVTQDTHLRWIVLV